MPLSLSKHQPDGEFDLERSSTPLTDSSLINSISPSKKRHLNDTFDCPHEKAPEVLDKHFELINKYKALQFQNTPPMSSDSSRVSPTIPEEEPDLSGAKLRAAALTIGTCLFVSGKFISSFVVNGTSVLINGSKSLYFFVTDTYEKNLENDKRRRLAAESSVNDRQSLDLSVRKISQHVDARSILATPSDKIPGAFGNTIHNQSSTKIQELDNKSKGEVTTPLVEPVPIAHKNSDTPVSTMLFRNSLDSISPLKTSPSTLSTNTQVDSLVLKSKSSFDTKDASKTRATELFNGIQRQKLGLLNRHKPSVSSKKMGSLSSQNFHDYLSDSRGLRKAYRVDPSRILIKKELPYLNSRLYVPQPSQQTELPEIAPKELYSKLYMKLSEIRERRDKEQRLLRKTEEEEKAKRIEIITPLSEDKIEEVLDLWNRKDNYTKVITEFRIDVTIYDLGTLRDGSWLNDTVIDFYMSMVTERSKSNLGKLPSCFVFSTHFFTTLESNGYKGVCRWAKRKGVDVTKLDYIFVPINRFNTHWCLAVINNKNKRFDFYDSMSGAGSRALELLKDYMYQQAADMHPEAKADYEDYKEISLKCPQQQNSYDCGVFVCKMVDVLSRDKDIMSFSQKDMPNLRRRIVYEITHNELLT